MRLRRQFDDAAGRYTASADLREACSQCARTRAPRPLREITQAQLDKIKKIAAQITPLYNKALTKAQENGWTNDEKTSQELAAIQALVQWTDGKLSDPSMYNDITDKDDYIKSMQGDS